jgi:hypothetical protein
MATIALNTEGPAGQSVQAAWSTWREAIRVVTRAAHLKKTMTIALVIGTIFFAINQLGLVMSGHIDGVIVAKSLMTYLTPFLVSNYSILLATRAR